MGLDMMIYGVEEICDDFGKSSGTWKEVVYLRKANQIHGFLSNFIDGFQDNFGYYHMSMGDVLALKKVCLVVLKNRGAANLILPEKQGCFFSSFGWDDKNNTYDDWYFDQLESCINQINQIDFDKYTRFFYHASW